ncbi:MAG: cytochrome bd-I oxidase subunit CydX [Methylovirgula sp.]|jgi:cyd operon protein YbgT
MWYFSWILGLGFAGAFSILNAMWLELTDVPPEVEAKQDAKQGKPRA